MGESEKVKLPENLKSKLLRFDELKKELDLRRKNIQSAGDKEIKENESEKTEK